MSGEAWGGGGGGRGIHLIQFVTGAIYEYLKQVTKSPENGLKIEFPPPRRLLAIKRRRSVSTQKTSLQQRCREIAMIIRRSTKATSTSKRLKAPQAPGESALDYLDRLRYGPHTDKPTTGKKSTPAIAPTTIIPAALTGISSLALPSHKHTSPDAKFPVRESDKEYTVFQREDDWSEASDEDDYDPAGGLPYCPRWNISRRRADAIIAHATRLSDDQLKSIKVAVVAQIIQVGAIKKALEKAEIGPTPVGFHEDIFLKKDKGDGSLVYWHKGWCKQNGAPEKTEVIQVDSGCSAKR
ncbi:hypothetical protein B0H14DRAFT_3593759 [Mycena olivaceomarginata]|nr:hypothetical protein B0H14DRAFT_3593759 [Mycena olivaceomarginata]